MTPPKMYLNSIECTVSGVVVLGVLDDEAGAEFFIGNINIPAVQYGYPFPGIIDNTQVYDRILSQADVNLLYNSGVRDSDITTNGLLFHGVGVNTSELATYVDQTLTSTMTVLDRITGAIGTPHGSPIGRASQ
jgi:hypothetical protein